jgi:hypothetical protein
VGGPARPSGVGCARPGGGAPRDLDGGLHLPHHFYSLAGQPPASEGRFVVRGPYEPGTGHLRLEPRRWLQQPPGWGKVDAAASLHGTR